MNIPQVRTGTGGFPTHLPSARERQMVHLEEWMHIQELHELVMSQSAIARQLALDRKTVCKYLDGPWGTMGRVLRGPRSSRRPAVICGRAGLFRAGSEVQIVSRRYPLKARNRAPCPCPVPCSVHLQRAATLENTARGLSVGGIC